MVTTSWPQGQLAQWTTIDSAIQLPPSHPQPSQSPPQATSTSIGLALPVPSFSFSVGMTSVIWLHDGIWISPPPPVTIIKDIEKSLLDDLGISDQVDFFRICDLCLSFPFSKSYLAHSVQQLRVVMPAPPFTSIQRQTAPLCVQTSKGAFLDSNYGSPPYILASLMLKLT